MGAGGIDANVIRDHDGRPYIPRSHLEGVLASHLRAVEANTAQALALFGRRANHSQEATFTSLRTCVDLISRTWHSTARVSFANRAPHEDTLRVIEYLPAGSKLLAEVELPEHCLPLLERLLQRCDCLGAGRTRGDGRVRWDIQPSASARSSAIAGAPTRRLRLELRAREAVCLPRTGVPGNTIPTEPFIRGQQLQGALAAWHFTRGAGASPSWSGISIGDALPLPGALGAETPADLDVLPTPLSLGSPKPSSTPDQRPWWAMPSGAAQVGDRLARRGDVAKRPAAEAHIARVGKGPWTHFKPAINVHLRHGPGETPADAPNLFAAEEIAAHTRFACDIDFAAGTDPTAFLAAFDAVLTGRSWLLVGRGRAPLAVEHTVWLAATPALRQEAVYRVTLTSELLLRDDWLRWLPGLDAASLVAACASSVDPKTVVLDGIDEAVEVRGFNFASGLPRAPALAIRRGSTYRLSGAGAHQLANDLVAAAPLGERTELGFGRLHVTPESEGHEVATSGPRAVTPIDSPRERILERAKTIADGIKGGPSRSQWFALRDGVLHAADVAAIAALLAGLGHKRGDRAWLAVEPALTAIKQERDRDVARELCDAIVRWRFPRARAEKQENHG